jgi:hypothetical protein
VTDQTDMCRHWAIDQQRSVCDDCNEAMVPGLRISIKEVRRAAQFLKDSGWGGFVSFDEAVRSLALHKKVNQ